jgi:hypothetical protein
MPMQVQIGGKALFQPIPSLGARTVWVVSPTPRPFCPQERHSTHRTGGWVGLGVGLDGHWKISPPTVFDPLTVTLYFSSCDLVFWLQSNTRPFRERACMLAYTIMPINIHSHQTPFQLEANWIPATKGKNIAPYVTGSLNTCHMT